MSARKRVERTLPWVFLRSFWLQGAWNFERAQNLGFLWALGPALDAIWNDPAERRAAGLRHLDYFSTQPHMSGYCLGAVAKLEEEMAAAPKSARNALEPRQRSVKAAMASACAAIGDPYFWSALRPFCVLAAVLVWAGAALAFWGGQAMREEDFTALPAWVFFAGSAAYVLLFNAVALPVRYKGVRRGYAEGADVAQSLKKARFREWETRLRVAGFAVTGVAALALLTAAAIRGDWWVLLAAAWMAGLKVWEFSNPAIYGALLALCAAAAMIKP